MEPRAPKTVSVTVAAAIVHAFLSHVSAAMLPSPDTGENPSTHILASHMAKKNGKSWNMRKKRGEKRGNGGHIQQKCRKRMPARQAGTGVSGKGGMVLHHDLPETAALPHRSQALREKRRTQICSVARQQRPSACRLLLFRDSGALKQAPHALK